MKITKYILSIAAAAGMLIGCQKQEMVQIAAPEDVVAPVLDAVADVNITPDNLALQSVVFTWTPADFGAATQVTYSLGVALSGSSDYVNLTSNVTKPADQEKVTVEISYEDLNAILLYDLELASGVTSKVDYRVAAAVGEYAPVYSAVVTANAAATAAEKVYPTLTVAGSYAYNNWTPGKGQFVFDFDGTDTKYSGMIDFGEDVSTLQFKFVGAAWGENEFSVPSGEEQAAEAAELPLVAGGGDNIAAYTTHRYYNLTLDKATPKLIKNFSFDQIGVIGDFNEWGADVVMEFNAAKQRFYADVEFPADGGFKFRLNGAWDVSYGSTGSGVLDSGDNIPVVAGKYRVYLDMNNPAEMTYSLNAAAYGTEENAGATEPEPEDPVEPETPALKGWGIVGAFTGWADGADVMLASDGTYLVAKGVELDGELKFRKDGGWDVNLGLAEGAAFEANAEIALAAGGGNIAVTAGTYDVYLDEANSKAWFINDGSYPGGGAAPEASEWGVVGDVNGWNAPDITMYKTATEGLFVAYNVAMPDGGFKIRANGVWDDAANYGLEADGTVVADYYYSLICGGGSKNISIAAGNYDIWFDLTNSKVYVMTPGKAISEAADGATAAPGEGEGEETEQEWFLVGDFNGWTAADANYKMTLENGWYVFKNFTADGKGVKFVADANWSVNRGGTFAAAGEAIEVVHNGENISPAAGTYDVYLSADATVAYFMTPGEAPAAPLTGTWYLVGDFNGWTAADENYKMTVEDGWYVFKNFTADGKGVKFVADANWSVNRGGTFVAAGEAIEVVHNGENISPAAGTYDVYLNGTEDKAYFMTPGTTPAE